MNNNKLKLQKTVTIGKKQTPAAPRHFHSGSGLNAQFLTSALEPPAYPGSTTLLPGLFRSRSCSRHRLSPSPLETLGGFNLLAFYFFFPAGAQNRMHVSLVEREVIKMRASSFRTDLLPLCQEEPELSQRRSVGGCFSFF